MKTHRKFSITTALLALLMACSIGGWAQLGKVSGTLKSGSEKKPLEKITLYQVNGGIVAGKLTDVDGKYEFSMLGAGDYTLEVTTAEASHSFEFTLAPGETRPLDLNIAIVGDLRTGQIMPGLLIIDHADAATLFTLDPMNPQVAGADDIKHNGGPRGIAGVVANFNGVFQKDHGDPMSFRGGRENSSATYIDGMKVRGSEEMPLAAIANITLLNGGIPAEYGDVTGGIVLVTTKNPGMKGSSGKPMTKSDREEFKLLRKKGSSKGSLETLNTDLVCL